MEIRSMLSTDIPQLAMLYQQFWGENSDVEKMKRLFGVISRNDTYILLSAAENDKLVGSVMGVVCQELYGDCKPFLVLENMIVDKNVRKRGVGKSLLKKLEEIAKSRNCSQIILVTEIERLDACAFYESCGFQANNKGYKKKL